MKKELKRRIPNHQAERDAVWPEGSKIPEASKAIVPPRIDAALSESSRLVEELSTILSLAQSAFRDLNQADTRLASLTFRAR